MSSRTKKIAICPAMVFKSGNGTVIEIPNFMHIGWKVQIGKASTIKWDFKTDLRHSHCSLSLGIWVGWILYFLKSPSLSIMYHGKHLPKYINSCNKKNIIPVARTSFFMYMYHEAHALSIRFNWGCDCWMFVKIWENVSADTKEAVALFSKTCDTKPIFSNNVLFIIGCSLLLCRCRHCFVLLRFLFNIIRTLAYSTRPLKEWNCC